jgi:5'-3' exonuclease
MIMKNYLFIDGSYYVFYRFHSLYNWYKLSHPDENIEETMSEPYNNDEFREKYFQLFETKLQEIPKKLKIQKPYIYIGKDCPRKEIWRHKFIENYKATRIIKENKNPKQFFIDVYENNLFEKSFNKIVNTKRSKLDIKPEKITLLKYDKLEADDCIALYVNYIIENEKDDYTITIITGDLDYLQLLKNEKIKIFNASLKPLNTIKNSLGCYKKDLLMKIIIGDKSDNIEPIMKKCGKKTAEKIVNDETGKELDKILEDDKVKNKFINNTLIIDFNSIPLELKNGFYDMYL